MAEVRLGGGNNSREVVRVGDTVRRAGDSGSAFAARVLSYLESADYPYAPRFLGVDDHGRDILTYIPGCTTDHPSQRAEGAYARAGLMLRLLHQATAGHSLAAGHECVLHGDPGPFNAIFQDGIPVAFIDWASSRPGSRLEDLGYMAWTWCIQSNGRIPIADQAQHLRELSDGYGSTSPRTLIEAMAASQVRILNLEIINADRVELPATRRQHARAAIAWAAADHAHLRRHETLLRAALEASAGYPER